MPRAFSYGRAPQDTAESARRFAAPLGVAAYDTMDALLADTAIEAVYLATPNSLHHAQTTAALRAGKHVLVEKPMALHAAEAEQTNALAAELGLVVGVGFHLRHSAVFRELKHQLESDAIGPPRLVRAAWGMSLGSSRAGRTTPPVLEPGRSWASASTCSTSCCG